MKQNIFGFLKKQWLVIWITAVSLLLFTVIASAEALVTLSPMKRVLVTKDGQGVLFSSNILDAPDPESGIAYQPVYKSGNGPYVVDMLLWNYDVKDESTRYPEDINYKIVAKLTDSTGAELDATTIGTRTITITPTSPSGTALTLSSSNRSDELLSQCLSRSESGSTENAYTLTFTSSTGWDLDNDVDICVQIRAIPTTKTGGGSYADLSELSKIIGLRKSRTTGSNGWDASISEKTDSNSPKRFDAYNLILSGSGSSKITVSWDTSKIDVNKNFYDSVSNVFGFDVGTNKEIEDNGVDGNGWHTIVVNADSGVNRNTGADAETNKIYHNRYILHLYKLGILDDGTQPASWDALFAKNSASANAWIKVNIE